jgi:hypothetical protein
MSRTFFSYSGTASSFLIRDIEPSLMLLADPAYGIKDSRCTGMRRKLAVRSRNQVPVRHCMHAVDLADHGPIRDLKA